MLPAIAPLPLVPLATCPVHSPRGLASRATIPSPPLPLSTHATVAGDLNRATACLQLVLMAMYHNRSPLEAAPRATILRPTSLCRQDRAAFAPVRVQSAALQRLARRVTTAMAMAHVAWTAWRNEHRLDVPVLLASVLLVVARQTTLVLRDIRVTQQFKTVGARWQAIARSAWWEASARPVVAARCAKVAR